MTIEVYPGHLQCNLDCDYCYQKFVNEAENIKEVINLEKLKRTLKKANDHFVLSGGEPLLVCKDKLEELWKWGYEKFGRNGLQTNGTLIDDDHIQMFEKYNVSVSLSVDGPGKLNSLRWAGSEEKTRKNTEIVLNNIERLLENDKIDTGVIITLHKANASSESRLNKLKEFFLWLKERGLRQGFLHFLIKSSENVNHDYTLDLSRYEKALLKLAKFMEKHPELNWQPFTGIKKKLSLEKNNNSICIWNNCDPFTTSALTAIHVDGSIGTCSQLYKEGFEWEKSSRVFYERYLSLQQTPQNLGGCKGCRFFLLCGGSCPARGKNHDWRNKASDCSVIKSLFGFYEEKMLEEGKTPLSRHENLSRIIKEKMKAWEEGRDISLQWILDENKDNNKHPGISGDILLTPGKETNEYTSRNYNSIPNNSLSKQDVRNGNWNPAKDHTDNTIHIDNSTAHIDSKAN